MFQLAREFKEKKEYDKGIVVLDRLQTIDSDNQAAQWIKEDMGDLKFKKEQFELFKDSYNEETKVIKEARESGIDALACSSRRRSLNKILLC